MPEFLRTTFDKFTFLAATDRLYTVEGVRALWIQLQGPTVTVNGVVTVSGRIPKDDEVRDWLALSSAAAER